MSTCRSCGAAVRWVKSAATGKCMILDAEPTGDGNIVLDIEGGVFVASVFKNAKLAKEFAPDEPRFLDHHVSCPQAKEWRRAVSQIGRPAWVVCSANGPGELHAQSPGPRPTPIEEVLT